MTPVFLATIGVFVAVGSELPPVGLTTLHPSPTQQRVALGVAGGASYGAVRHARIAEAGFPQLEAWVRAAAAGGQVEARLTTRMVQGAYRIELSARESSWRWAITPSLGVGAGHVRAASDKTTTALQLAPGVAAMLLWDEGRAYLGAGAAYVWAGERIVYDGGAADTFRSGGFVNVSATVGSVVARGDTLSCSVELGALYARSRGRPDVVEAWTLMPSVAVRL